MKDAERARVMELLSAVELSLSELRSVGVWWNSLGEEYRFRLLWFQGECRAYEFELQHRWL